MTTPVAPHSSSSAAATRSPLSDGEWHRLHPLTPLLRGGLFLLVVIGIVVANLRDRLFSLVFPWLLPQLPDGQSWEDVEAEGDPIDFIVANNLIIVALLAVLVFVLILMAWFTVSWRFHTFRITGDEVEVRSGVLFRTHRRAPLDRVQGVNLTRPMVARLLGAAKLEVVGAGIDGNVKLEYLSTSNAEAVRGDILRLASGRRLAAGDAGASTSTPLLSVAGVSAGITGLIEGAEGPVAEPESIVRIPPGRLIVSHLLSWSSVVLVLLIVAIVVGSVVGTPFLLFSLVPTLIAFGAFWMRTITRSLRYSVAPTAAGVRITFGLFTTITEVLPPGRVHAVEISQPVLWRGLGWWVMRVNRLSGRAATDSAAQQFADVLPVGDRQDVERVLPLLLPGLPADAWDEVLRHGILGPVDGDPFTNSPRRARLLRLLSWRRNGFRLTSDALFLRRGFLRRRLIVLPLARLQSLRIAQGPLARALDIATITGHTVLGPVSGELGVVDRAAAVRLWEEAAAAAVAASAADRSHRWDEGGAEGHPPSVGDADAGGAAGVGADARAAVGVGIPDAEVDGVALPGGAAPDSERDGATP